ncbi:IS3 family transposase [Xenorhabdus sp. VLS]|uniref:IS3 family transposase n=1 Tax=Xenorhabdus lircayensis TaxID=2763499 RepID=A0ABS0U0Y8_9GAMM|nr:IS3 family transposase [Xenorhabdus lircayensis]
MVERFFGSLKYDWLFKSYHKNPAEMKQDVLNYLHYYNLIRLHAVNSYLTPVKYEMAFEVFTSFVTVLT